MRARFALLSILALSAPAPEADATPLRITGRASVTSVDAALGSGIQPGDRIGFSFVYDPTRVVERIDNQFFGTVYDVEFVAVGSGEKFAATAAEGRTGIENDVPISGGFLDSYAFGSFTAVQGDPLNSFAPSFIDVFVREFASAPPDLVKDDTLPIDPVAVLSNGPAPANVRMTYGSLNVFGDVNALRSVPIPEPSGVLLFCVGALLVGRVLGRK
jgi:hypothetical protein